MKILIIYLILINMSAFIFMGVDKHRAKRGAWRISEGTLFLLSVIGGSIGSLAGMYTFRHKTRHGIFVVGMPLILILHILIAVLLFKLI